MRHATQDPKYDVENGMLVNAATGKPIPADEPVFILRAKDIHAIDTLYYYRNACENSDHAAAVEQRIEEFEDFTNTHLGFMKEPDTTSA